MVGTVDYMAPEQVTGAHIDARTDIYALGCVFYQMLTGKVPYERENSVATLFAHVHDPAPPLEGAITNEYPAFAPVIGKAMAKEPADRYLSAGDFARDAAAVLAGSRYTGQPTIVATGEATVVGAVAAGTVASPVTARPAARARRTRNTRGPASRRRPAAEPLPPPPDRTVVSGGAAAATAAVAPAQRSDPPAQRAGSERAAAVPAVAAATAGAAPPAGPPPAQRGSGDDSSRSPKRFLLPAAIAAAVAGGIVGGGRGELGWRWRQQEQQRRAAAPPPARPPRSAGVPFKTGLKPVPTNHVTGSGNTAISLSGDVATVTIDTNGLLNGQPHAMHIHAGGQGICPPASAARPHNGHLSISTSNGIRFYGPPEVALTTSGDTSRKSIIDFSRFPTAGDIRYKRTITLPAGIAGAIRAGNAVIIVHGIDYNGNGIYDNVLDRSDLKRSLPGESTAPALCGTLVKTKTASTTVPGRTASATYDVVWRPAVVATRPVAGEQPRIALPPPGSGGGAGGRRPGGRRPGRLAHPETTIVAFIQG